jgi:hypothetical protein
MVMAMRHLTNTHVTMEDSFEIRMRSFVLAVHLLRRWTIRSTERVLVECPSTGPRQLALRLESNPHSLSRQQILRHEYLSSNRMSSEEVMHLKTALTHLASRKRFKKQAFF